MLKPGVLCDYCGKPIGREEIERGEAVRLGAECFCGKCVHKHDLLGRDGASYPSEACLPAGSPPAYLDKVSRQAAERSLPAGAARAGMSSPPASASPRTPAGAHAAPSRGSTVTTRGTAAGAVPFHPARAGHANRSEDAGRPTGRSRVPSAVAKAPTARITEPADARPRAARTARETSPHEDARHGPGRASGKNGRGAAAGRRILLLSAGAVLGGVLIAAILYLAGGSEGRGARDRNDASRVPRGDPNQPERREAPTVHRDRKGGTAGDSWRPNFAAAPKDAAPAGETPPKTARPNAGGPNAGKSDPGPGKPDAWTAKTPRPEQRRAETISAERHVPKRKAGEEELNFKDDSALSEEERNSRGRARASVGNAAKEGYILLSSFEKDEDFLLWSYRAVRPFRGREGVGDGAASLRLEPEESPNDPKALCSIGIDLDPGAEWNWSRGEILRFDAYNDSGEPLELFVVLKWLAEDAIEQYSFKFTLDKGTKHELSALLSEASKDLDKVCRIEFSFPRGDAEHPRALYLDRIRVEMKAE